MTGRVTDRLSSSPVIYGSCALTPGAPYSLSVEPLGGPASAKRMLGSGIVGSSGAVERTIHLPVLAAGSYKLVMTSRSPQGQTLMLTNHISANADQTYSSISAESLQPHLK